MAGMKGEINGERIARAIRIGKGETNMENGSRIIASGITVWLVIVAGMSAFF